MNPNVVMTHVFRVHNQNFDKLIAYFHLLIASVLNETQVKGPIAMNH